MARKVFISVLGTGFYDKCKYSKDNFISSETRFVQQATLEYLGAKNWTANDAVLILLTEGERGAEKVNWNKTITEKENLKTKEIEPYNGLQTCLNNLELPFEPTELPIPDGKNEEEMWKIFKLLYHSLEDNDELYFDLTHSFRYLPMLVLVFSSYAKFLKKVKVAHISYGNYEARDVSTNIAPIIDLLPISALQDWTFAAANYLENGNVDRLIDLSSTALQPILREAKGTNLEASTLKKFINCLNDVIEERQTCRGINIIKSTHFAKLKRLASQLDSTIIQPLNPVFEKIKNSLDDFDENENVNNGFAAAKWCFDNGLFQQAVTILYENLTTLICFEENIDWKDEKERAIVEAAYYIVSNDLQKDESKWNIKKIKPKQDQDAKILIRKIIKKNYFIKLCKDYNKLGSLRNDINHSGMRDNPSDAQTMKRRLLGIIESINDLLK